jgi:hypothetical protein
LGGKGCNGPKVKLGSEVEGGRSGRAEEIRGRKQTSSVGPKEATGRKWGKEKEKKKRLRFIFREYFRERNNLEIAR